MAWHGEQYMRLYMLEHGIQLTTFDSESELHKMKAARLDEIPGKAWQTLLGTLQEVVLFKERVLKMCYMRWRAIRAWP
jgi:hypothetical protein